ncbi:hypothetical protein KKF38_05380 [Patescibacteria group bacterium]|nr:hypothetical protein [Patescibacteria group bacterium]
MNHKETNYDGAAIGAIVVFFVAGFLSFIIGSMVFPDLENLGILVVLLSWSLMLITQFLITGEISWKAVEPLLYFGLIGPIWALVGVLLMVLKII